MTPYSIPYATRQSLERMVKRNEKALLRTALVELRVAAGGQPIEGVELYLAACHKHGAQVAQMLIDAGVIMGSDKPLGMALQRGLPEVAKVLAHALVALPDFEVGAVKTTHPLHVAARSGQMQVLETLFALPCKHAWSRNRGDIPATEKASYLLHSMAIYPHDPGVPEDRLRETVAFLVKQGGDVEYHNADGFSIPGRAPVLFQAAINANLPLMRALVEAGADAKRALPAEERYRPHPYPTVAACLLLGLRENFEKNKKKVLPIQVDALDYLASMGVGGELSDNEIMKDLLPRWISHDDRERIERTIEHAHIVANTGCASGARARARL